MYGLCDEGVVDASADPHRYVNGRGIVLRIGASVMRASACLTACLAVFFASGALAAQQAATPTQPAAKQTEDRQICRRMQESGSLARVRRVCYTRAQWDRLAEQQRANSPSMTAFSGSASGQ